MVFLVNKSLDAYYNMAVEEYFLDRHNGNFFILWQNKNAIVVGKNQNTLAEIDSDFVKEKGIDLVRRLSGGGAMYQDLGNLNFTFICDEKKWFSDYSYFTTPVIEAMKSLGVTLTLSGRNDIMLGDFKVSGNAQAVRGERILHHGTLLIDCDLSVLGQALTPDKEKIAAKGIKSVSSRVININDTLCEKLTVSQVVSAIKDAVVSLFPDTVVRDISEDEDAEIKALAEKYRSWDWNFGSSPKYTFHNKKRFASGIVEVKLDVLRGVIQSAKFEGDFFGVSDVLDIEKAICGVNHNEDDIFSALCDFNFENYFMGIGRDEILSLIKP
ncbi:MAG: lipoate--protein ligase [Clostridia bacterium]|nr:lipoate--protein ligase [Clostridia bacterium]